MPVTVVIFYVYRDWFKQILLPLYSIYSGSTKSVQLDRNIAITCFDYNVLFECKLQPRLPCKRFQFNSDRAVNDWIYSKNMCPVPYSKLHTKSPIDKQVDICHWNGSSENICILHPNNWNFSQCFNACWGRQKWSNIEHFIGKLKLLLVKIYQSPYKVFSTGGLPLGESLIAECERG